MDKPLTDAERERFFQSVGMIVEAFEDCGFKLVPIDPEERRRGKEGDRTEDRRLLASGEMTADQLLERNAFSKARPRFWTKVLPTDERSLPGSLNSVLPGTTHSQPIVGFLQNKASHPNAGADEVERD